MIKKFGSLGLLMILAMVAPHLALAHAFPDHAQPAIGGTVSAPPTELRIWFTEKIEPAFSHVAVVDARGAQVDKGDAHVDAKDPVLLLVSLNPLPPGTYKVEWHVVSADTHPTQGVFSFTVK